MRRIRWAGAGVAVAGLFLAFVGCDALPRAPWESGERWTFWETFDSREAAAKHKSALSPCDGSTSGMNALIERIEGKPLNKQFKFHEVKRSEQEMADALGRIKDEMLARVVESGAKVAGEVRVAYEGGVFREFEFDYRHHGVGGLVRGRIWPGDPKPGWNLECVVAQEAPR